MPTQLRERLDRPTPRVRLGAALRGVASAMIDVSDGLAADLGHILEESGTGGEIRLPGIPLSPAVAQRVAADADWSLPLTSGDDYELCFTLPPRNKEALASLLTRVGCPARPIGRITERPGLRCLLDDGSAWVPRRVGYDHFSV